MSNADLLAGTVMDAAAALMNDVNRRVYTYAVQVPYLNIALHELQELFALNSIPVTEKLNIPITVPAGLNIIDFGTSNPKLPNDLVEPVEIWESTSGLNQWTKMSRVITMPPTNGNPPILGNRLEIWNWENQRLYLSPANNIIDIKMEYIRSLFTNATDENSVLNILNSETFLEYRTAGLLARFVGENPTRATELDGLASLGLDRVSGISNKGKQSIVVRRRPFRQSYKRRVVR